jgi:hypothetical protein
MRNTNTRLANGVIARFELANGNVLSALSGPATCLTRLIRSAFQALPVYLDSKRLKYQRPSASDVTTEHMSGGRFLWNSRFTAKPVRIVAEQRYPGHTGWFRAPSVS